MTSSPRRLVVGITGATGIIYGVRALEMCRDVGIETHLVVTRAGHMTRAFETELSRRDLCRLADCTYPANDVGASIASGSYLTDGMLIAPCSMRTLAEIAHGTTSNLLTRAADVTLKERRRLVLLTRETPLHAGHLKAMLAATEAGAVVAPPVPAFYDQPTTVDELVDHTVARALDLFGVHHPNTNRWHGKHSSANEKSASSEVRRPGERDHDSSG